MAHTPNPFTQEIEARGSYIQIYKPRRVRPHSDHHGLPHYLSINPQGGAGPCDAPPHNRMLVSREGLNGRQSLRALAQLL